MQGDYHLINNQFALNEAIKRIRLEYAQHGKIYVQVDRADTRTGQQNKSLHVYCRLLAQALNDAGFDMRKTVREEVEIPWNGDRVKDVLWRPIQKAITGEDSTRRPRPDEYPKIYETLNRVIAERTGVHVPWPVRDAA